jgi:hypothetical protein
VLASLVKTSAAYLPWLSAKLPDPSQASLYLALTAMASLTKLPDPSQTSPTSHQQPRHLDKAAKPTVSRDIPWSKFPPSQHFVPKGFSKSFLPNSSGYGVITTKNLAIPAHKDGSKNTSNHVFSQLIRCQTTLTTHLYLLEDLFEVEICKCQITRQTYKSSQRHSLRMNAHM